MARLTFIAASVGLFFSSTSTASPLTASLLDKRATVLDCLTSSKVPFDTSGSADWTQAIKPFNLRVPFTPGALAVPQTVQDVQNAVRCGAQNNFTVTPKSGGHSYGSHGLGGENGHLIVDMRNFANVTVNLTDSTAIIGTGGRIGDVAEALYSQGKQAIAHGTCPGVGMGGLTLHGGYGLMSRSKGLTLDQVEEVEVVLANSSVVTASTTENSDLFWALRGAGSAFGIVTHFKFKTFTAPEGNIVFNWNVNPSSAANLVQMLTALQNFTRHDQPPELDMRFYLSWQTTFSGVYYGTQAQFQAVITPLLTKMGLTMGTTTTNGWLDTLLAFSNGPLPQAKPYDTHETFFAKSLMPDWLSPDAMNALANYWAANAKTINRGWYLLIDCHGGDKAAITQVPLDNTAYAHRNATLKMQFYDVAIFGSYDPSWQSFLNGWVGAIETASPGKTYGMYINYADTSLNSSQAHLHYWLMHYEKLTQIKNVWDPAHLFEGPQLVGSLPA